VVVDDGVLRDVGQVAADERQRLLLVHALDLVEAVDRLLVAQITPERVHRIRRIGDDLARFQRLDGTPHLSRLRGMRVDLDDHLFGTRERC
jgi:hypothetical protein